jgi:hypothetical protein
MDTAIDGPKETWVLGEFADPHALVAATARMREQGFIHMDTYSPYPLHGGSEALGLPPSRVPLLALTGGLTGVITAFAFQTYMNTIDYPINVGGRPLLSWPTWVPIMFELGVLLAAFSIFFGLLGLSRLPQPYHPVFESDAFRSASTHGYWLSVEARDGQTPERVQEALGALGATQTQVVTGERE